jgi:hypothetical protein
MTEPIKLPPYLLAGTLVREGVNKHRARDIEQWMNEEVALAVEQNTAELRAEVERLRAELAIKADNLRGAEGAIAVLLDQRDKCIAQRDEAHAEVERLRAELARLTTLRPHACDDEYDGEKLFWGKDGDSWICDPLFVHSTHWTPLPDVKETK